MELTTILNAIIEYYQTLILFSFVTLLIHAITSKKNLPPGPCGLPLVGYFPFLKRPPHIGITTLGERYGNVMSFYLGSVLVVVLGDYDAIKEAFVKQGNVFASKPSTNPFRIEDSDKGLVLNDAEEASHHRRFILSTFRDFGMGKSSLEPQILDEIKYFLDEIKKTNGEPFDLKLPLSLSVSNIIAMLDFGKRYEYSDPEFIRMKHLLTSSGEFIGAVALGVFLPWTKYIPFLKKLAGGNQLKTTHRESRQFFLDKLEENKKNYIEGSRSHYIDGYLTERNAIIKATGSEGYFDIENLLGNMGGLFSAGTETTTGILLWSVIYLLKYPEVKKRVLHEIEEIIGDKDPTMNDKNNMIYTDAFILEVHRHSSLIPFTLVHGNSVETTVFGYTIPNRSYVIGNLWAVHHDKKLWGDPEVFRPERFISEQGKVVKPEYLIPFSMGKRNCVGESLANMEIFLYLISFLQAFDIQIPDGQEITFESKFGIGLSPVPFKICAIAK